MIYHYQESLIGILKQLKFHIVKETFSDSIVATDITIENTEI